MGVGSASYQVGEFAFSISSGDASLAVLLRDACADLDGDPTPRRGDAVSVQAPIVDDAHRFLVPAFFSELNPQVVNAHPGWPVFHAGAVALPPGALVVFGLSGAGKSTLTAALVQRGAGYLTDEAVLIEPGREVVHPYAKPLSLDANSLALLEVAPGAEAIGEIALRAEALGGRAVRSPVSLWGFCHLVRSSEPLSRVRRLAPADAIMAMLPSYMCFSPERDALDELVDLVRVRPVWEIRGGTPRQAAAAVGDLRDARPDFGVEPLGRFGPLDPIGDPAPLVPAHLGPFSAPARRASLVGVRYEFDGVVLDAGSGEHLRMSGPAFRILESLDGRTPIRDAAQRASVEGAVGVRFVRTLAERGWLQGCGRSIELPVHPHVTERARAAGGR